MSRLYSTDGEYEELTLFHHSQTEKAIQVSMDGLNKTWLPKSLLEDASEVFLVGEAPEIVIVIPVWLAEEKELI